MISSATAAYTDSSGLNGGNWRILADMHSGRADPGAVAYDGKVYVVGGFFSPGSGYPNSWEIYDPIADLWEIHYGLPIARSDLMVAGIGDKIFAIGGYRTDTGVIGANHEYDPLTGTWLTKTSMITATSGAGVAVITNTIYILGGHDNVTNRQDVQIYDPISNSWSTGASMTTARAELGAAALDGKIFAIGGVTEGGNTTDIMEVYDPASDSWSNGPKLPAPRASAAIGVRDGMIYVIGGTDNWALKTTVNTVFVYEPGANSWSMTTSMPTARWATEAAVIGDIIYVVGGAGATGVGTANEAYPFQPAATSLTVTDSPDPTWANQPFTVSFTVTAEEGIPTGVVAVTVGSGPQSCSASLVNGGGSCQLAISAPGSYLLNANYSGSSDFAPSNSAEEHTVRFGVYLPFLSNN
jgi:N-acetylneuraminic acid mutarotase